MRKRNDYNIEQIKQMPLGREMDMLIAKAMGFNRPNQKTRNCIKVLEWFRHKNPGCISLMHRNYRIDGKDEGWSWSFGREAAMKGIGETVELAIFRGVLLEQVSYDFRERLMEAREKEITEEFNRLKESPDATNNDNLDATISNQPGR